MNETELKWNASKEQVKTGYPEFEDFLQAKDTRDPQNTHVETCSTMTEEPVVSDPTELNIVEALITHLTLPNSIRRYLHKREH